MSHCLKSFCIFLTGSALQWISMKEFCIWIKNRRPCPQDCEDFWTIDQTRLFFVSFFWWKCFAGQDGREAVKRWGGPSRVEREREREEEREVKGCSAHLLSERFLGRRLRSNHPQEDKQTLISVAQSPAMSPGLWPPRLPRIPPDHKSLKIHLSLSSRRALAVETLLKALPLERHPGRTSGDGRSLWKSV